MWTWHATRVRPTWGSCIHAVRSLLPRRLAWAPGLQVVLTAPLAKWSGRNVHSRNRLLLLGFAFMVAADLCFALPACATPAGGRCCGGCATFQWAPPAAPPPSGSAAQRGHAYVCSAPGPTTYLPTCICLMPQTKRLRQLVQYTDRVHLAT